MKRKTEMILIIIGFLISIPFYYYRFADSISISEQYLHSLGIAAMVGIIMILIGFLNLSTRIELKIIPKNKLLDDRSNSE